ncbi:trypsin-like serine peptidase [Pseudomarimonas arenosa]|uniref:Trypsin-like peptidase domain-containing protein n=1 Tax=Pseudomarimonas arenosa TaxID=2774145 RepID=A0AAW3ZJP6_9GAMM|nr:trypsin-like peptidase domain-containing protein [Pseudomarimonas arenosa]MBD8525680.1 trypsin-like peptidase domain-containing protein [Pseudomarimonas arenosa]
MRSVFTRGMVLAGMIAFSSSASMAGSESSAKPDADGTHAQMSGYRLPAAKTRQQAFATMGELHAWLNGLTLGIEKGGGIELPLRGTERKMLGLDCDDCAPLQADERRHLVGIAQPINLRVDFAEISWAKRDAEKTLADGQLRRLASGDWVWRLRLSSPGAAGLRVALSEVDLPRHAALYVYNSRGEAFGPYVGRGAKGSGQWVTNMLSGDELFLQLVMRTPAKGEFAPRFRIDDLGHISARFELARQLNATYSAGKLHCTQGIDNAGCVENAECFNNNDFGALSDARNAVGAMLFRSGGGYYICSGGLIANAANAPLFLTANHCISKGNEANSLEVYWNHTTSCGTRQCAGAWEVQGRATEVGAAILASGRSGDFTLLQLNSTLPQGAFAMGWNSTPVANAGNTQLFRVSHPQGAPQAFSIQTVNTTAGTCGTLPRGNYIYSTDQLGATEGGSSGSPVMNAAGEIVGQLYGACGSNLNDVCDAGSNRTVDGAFANYFSSVEQHLTGGSEPPPPGGGFSLTASGSKDKGKWVGNLAWSGSSASQIDVYREGAKIATVANSGGFVDVTDFRGGGSLTYQVCAAGTSTCSNESTASF